MAVMQATTGGHEATRSKAASMGWVVAFAVLLAISAQIRFFPPGSAVPVTLQTAVVLLCGYCLRPRLAAAATALYLAVGFVAAAAAPGLALFAAVALGKTVTLGYLVGFFVAAVVVSVLCEQFTRLTFGRALAVGIVGTAIVFACGLIWLTLLTGSVTTAMQQGLAPFVGWGLVKTGCAAALASAVQVRK